MAYPVSRQLLELLAALAWGAGLGLAFDAGRALRRILRLTAAFDALWCAAAALALFTLRLGPGGGKLSLHMLAMAALGAGLYFAGPGRAVRAVLYPAADGLRALLGLGRVPAKFFVKFSKKLFQNLRRWFTIICTDKIAQEAYKHGRVSGTQPLSEGGSHEDKAGRYIY